ncbi:MAG TPA: phosphatase PAP2 family protein [Acidimicrobiales bacterium]|jgi:undecaprenyl-diphosphatase|nr:phosphatase PAP2 family protein [Acidimicrobiales bacterium]
MLSLPIAHDAEQEAPARDATGHAWRLPLVLVALIGAGLGASALVRPGGEPGAVQYVDDRVRGWVLAHRTPTWEHVVHPVTAFGDVRVVLVLSVLAGGALLLCRRGIRQGLVPVVAALGTDAMVYVLKYTVNRPGTRGHWGEPAFPSGHISGMATLVVPLAVLAWTTRRRWWPAVGAALAIAAMAATLLVLDAHWLSDIVAGAVLTTAWCAAVAWWLPKRTDRLRRRGSG